MRFGLHWTMFSRSFEFRRGEEEAIQKALADPKVLEELNRVRLAVRSKEVREETARFTFGVSCANPNLAVYGIIRPFLDYALLVDLVAEDGTWKVKDLVRQ